MDGEERGVLWMVMVARGGPYRTLTHALSYVVKLRPTTSNNNSHPGSKPQCSSHLTAARNWASTLALMAAISCRNPSSAGMRWISSRARNAEVRTSWSMQGRTWPDLGGCGGCGVRGA